MSQQGITNAGKSTNELYCTITGFKMLPSSDPKGDAEEYIYDESNHKHTVCVELKKDTYNQVRPHLYITLIGYDTIKDEWYVIPPDDILLFFADHKKGHHTVDPIECINMGKVNSAQFIKYKTSSNNLKQKVIDAFFQGEKNILVKEYAKNKNIEYKNQAQKIWQEIKHLKEEINAQITK